MVYWANSLLTLLVVSYVHIHHRKLLINPYINFLEEMCGNECLMRKIDQLKKDSSTQGLLKILIPLYFMKSSQIFDTHERLSLDLL